MWDDAQALGRLSNTLFGISLLLVLYGIVHYAVHLPVFGVQVVQLEDVPEHVDVAQVRNVVQRDLHGNFFTMDLETVRQSLEQLPWVRQATVRRHFPWQLDVALEGDIALASWNGNGLVNLQGEVFNSGNVKPDLSEQKLPAFNGPESSAQEVTRYFGSFTSELAPLGQQIAEVKLSPRQAWQLRLQNGMVLELGRQQMEQRLARFVAAYPDSVAKIQPPVKYVDLRYRNGFAVRLTG
jgi:cell division protein FtsQ